MTPSWGAIRHRLTAKVRGGAVVLLYHRVAEPLTDPWDMAVTPAHFSEHMAVLRQHGAVVPLRVLPELLRGRRVRQRCVAVTFDDGYADNLQAALPVLEQEDIAATLFVTTGTLGGKEFWWDRLTRLLLLPGNLPRGLSLSVGGKQFEWNLGACACYSEEAFAAHRNWRTSSEPPAFRQALFLALWRFLQLLDPAEQAQALEQVLNWGVGAPSKTHTARALTIGELTSLANNPLIEIGCHTISHPKLSLLGPSEQSAEIVGSKRTMEALIGRQISSFSYPFGGSSDFDANAVHAVERAGFERACVNEPGIVTVTTDRYRIPRLYIHDYDGSAFEERLTRWLGRLGP